MRYDPPPGPFVALLALLAAMLVSAHASALTIVEFYNPAQDHYFITGEAGEIADLDNGVHPGWRRTGQTFAAMPSGAPDASAVCRFYIPPALGDSHFFSASVPECEQTRGRFPAFQLESSDAFRVTLPDAVTGACGALSVPVYRLWDGRVDTNHRYTTRRTVWQQMRDLHWIAEGYGPGQVAFCAPAGAIGTINVAVSGRAVIKARAAGAVVGLLEERLNTIFEDGPDRILALVQADGRTTRTYAAPPGWSLVDFAVHPSGDISLAMTTARTVRIVRLDRDANVLTDQPFTDPAASADPFFTFDPSIKDDDSLQPAVMHDAARVVPLGDSVGLVLRTGRNAIVAYRLDLDGTGGYQQAWRTLVEPGSSIDGVFLESGSFDTFGQLANHVGLHVDADAGGTLAVGIVESPFRSFPFEAHAAYFGEPIAAHAGVLVTRVSGEDGHRLGSTVIDTHQLAELHGLRATGAGFVLEGRVRTENRPDGGGWDAWLARTADDGSLALYRVVDVQLGDVFFDAVQLASGRYLALGTTGYVQNPNGASISEETAPLLLLLAADGTVLERIARFDGPRQDQVRTILSLDQRWILGGMTNGPGTHSADGQRQLVNADGYLLEATGLPTD